jgi:hypothetical protein
VQSMRPMQDIRGGKVALFCLYTRTFAYRV